MQASNSVSCRWPDTFPEFGPSSYELVVIKWVFHIHHPRVLQKFYLHFLKSYGGGLTVAYTHALSLSLSLLPAPAMTQVSAVEKHMLVVWTKE